MKQYLRTYQIELTVRGPVFIGNGKTLSKKEYRLCGDYAHPYQKVQVIDIAKFYHYLQKRRLAERFEDYLLNSSYNLEQWLSKNRINDRDIEKMIRYELPCGETSLERGTSVTIMEFVKDPYGNPYVPGSSVKGMLRTILLSYLYEDNPDQYAVQKRTLRDSAEKGGSRMSYLRREMADVEKTALYTLGRDKENRGNAVNDMMAGMIVGDSMPLKISDLVLCQKVDRDVEGKPHNINILRECFRPGTVIYVPLTIDTSLCKIDPGIIEDAVKCFINQYYDNYLSSFKQANRLMEDRVFLGGGAGYVSKTIVYPMYGKEEGIRVAMDVFSATLSPKVQSQHKHYKDNHFGASPHILKCTKFEGKTYQMGLCQMKIIET